MSINSMPTKIEFISCLVTAEWTGAVASILSNLQSCEVLTQLWRESALLDQLLYKNTNQHRGTRPFQRLLEVRRLLHLARDADLDSALAALRDAAFLASRPTLTLQERPVPTRGAAMVLARRLLGCCHAAEAVVAATLAAAAQFTTQLAQSFFMPLSLTCLAVLGRLRVLGSQLLVDCIRAYNAAVELAELLPAGAVSGACALASLPCLLRCCWDNGRPVVQATTADDYDGAVNGAFKGLLGLRVVGAAPGNSSGGKERTPAPAISRSGLVEEEGAYSGQAVAREAFEQQPLKAPQAALAVAEDRGEGVSREALRAELRGEAPAAGGGLLQQAPSYVREAAAMGLPKPPRKEEKKRKKEASRYSAIAGTAAASLQQPTVRPTVSAMPERWRTAFINIEALQKPSGSGAAEEQKQKKKSLEQKGAEEEQQEVKSWQDWLAPLGGAAGGGKQQQKDRWGGGRSGGGKKRRKYK